VSVLIITLPTSMQNFLNLACKQFGRGNMKLESIKLKDIPGKYQSNLDLLYPYNQYGYQLLARFNIDPKHASVYILSMSFKESKTNLKNIMIAKRRNLQALRSKNYFF
jgi:hypothetical protein